MQRLMHRIIIIAGLGLWVSGAHSADTHHHDTHIQHEAHEHGAAN